MTELAKYQVRESSRARRIKLQINAHEGLVVVTPRGIAREEIDILVRSQSNWIKLNLKKLSSRKEYLVRRFGEGLPSLVSLPGITQSWKINYSRHTKKPGWKYVSADRLEIYGNPDQAQKSLEKWLTAVAREHLQEKLSSLGAETGLTFQRMQIRSQKSRWGSCSSRGTISLNRNILFFAPEVVRYLLVHELCHTKYMNHSKAYWALVEKFCPAYKSSDKLLKEAWKFLPPWAVK